MGNALAGASPLVLVGALAFGLQAWLLYQLFRQNGRLIERVSTLEAASGRSQGDPGAGLPVGAFAPLFALPDLDGRGAYAQP